MKTSARPAVARQGRWLGAAAALVLAALSSALAQDSIDTAIDEVRSQLDASRYEAAEDAARALLAREPGAGDAWRLLGDAFSARGRHTQALDAYAKALQYSSTQPLAVQVAMARIHHLAARDEAADALWKSVMRTWREGTVDSAPALIAVAEAALALGQGDPALKRTALRLYEEAIDRAPLEPAAHLALGELLLSSYNNAEAVPLFDKALQLAPQNPRALLAVARSQHFDHNPGAVQSARAAVTLAPALVDARIFLARVLVERDDAQAAQRHLEAALAVNPRAVEALSLLAALRDRTGDEDAAQQLMALVLTIAPRYGEGFVILAQLAADRRRYADAVRYAMRAVDLDARNWRAHALAGMNLLRLGRNAAARERLEAAFRGDPFNIWTKNTLDLLDAMDGYAVLERGRFVLTGRAEQVEVLAPYLFAVAEQAWAAHAASYGVTPATPIRIEVHPQHEDLSVRTLGLTGADLLGVSFGPTLVIEGPAVNPGGPFNWASVLWHELAHTFQLELSHGRAPRWLAEGMAVHDEHSAGREGWGQDIGPAFLQAHLQGRLAKASGLNDRFLNPESQDDVGNAYLQAGLLVAMIDRDHGSASLPMLLQGYRNGSSTAQLLDEVLGVTAEQFDAAFDSYLQQHFGAALAALTPAGGSDEEKAGDSAGDGARHDAPVEHGEQASDYAQLLRRAAQASLAGDLQAAETALLKARALLPGHTGERGPHRLLIDLYRRMEDRPRLIEAARELARVDADDPVPLLSLADELQRAGDKRGAIDALQRALLIQPFDIGMHERLAELLEATGSWRTARVERAAVVALGAADPVGAQYRLALAASRSGDAQGARRAILAALENAPLFEDGLMLLLAVREQLASSNTPADRARGGTAAEGRQQ